MIYSKQLKLTFWAGGEAPRGSRPPPPSRMILTPTLRFPSHGVRRNKSIISCQISAFTSFDPLKLVFSPVFYIFWKILVPFTKFDLIVVFEKCVCVTQFVREHDRAKNVAWMALWCSLDGVLRIFPHTSPTVKLLAYMLQRIHIYKLGIRHIHECME